MRKLKTCAMKGSIPLKVRSVHGKGKTNIIRISLKESQSSGCRHMQDICRDE